MSGQKIDLDQPGQQQIHVTTVRLLMAKNFTSFFLSCSSFSFSSCFFFSEDLLTICSFSFALFLLCHSSNTAWRIDAVSINSLYCKLLALSPPHGSGLVSLKFVMEEDLFGVTDPLLEPPFVWSVCCISLWCCDLVIISIPWLAFNGPDLCGFGVSQALESTAMKDMKIIVKCY